MESQEIIDDTRDVIPLKIIDIHQKIHHYMQWMDKVDSDIYIVLSLFNVANGRLDILRNKKTITFRELPESISKLDIVNERYKIQLRIIYIESAVQYEKLVRDIDDGMTRSIESLKSSYGLNIPFTNLTKRQIETIKEVMHNFVPDGKCRCHYDNIYCPNEPTDNGYCKLHLEFFSKYKVMCKFDFGSISNDLYALCRQINDTLVLGYALNHIGFDCSCYLSDQAYLYLRIGTKPYESNKPPNRLCEFESMRNTILVNSDTGDIVDGNELLLFGYLDEKQPRVDTFELTCRSVLSNRSPELYGSCLVYLVEFYNFYTERCTFGGKLKTHRFLKLFMNECYYTQEQSLLRLIKIIDSNRNDMYNIHISIKEMIDKLSINTGAMTEDIIQEKVVNSSVDSFNRCIRLLKEIEVDRDIRLIVDSINIAIVAFSIESLKYGIYNLGISVLVDKNNAIKGATEPVDTSDYEIYFSDVSSTDSEGRRRIKKKKKFRKKKK